MPAVPGKMKKPNPWPAEIVADVSQTRAMPRSLAWTKKLDHFDPARVGVWISRKEIRSAERHVSPTFLNAIRRAARNVRGVSEKQLPRPVVIRIRAGSTNQPARFSDRIDRLLHPAVGIFRWSQLLSHDRRSRPSRRRLRASLPFVPDRIPNCLQPQSCSALRNCPYRLALRRLLPWLRHALNSPVEKIFGPGNKYVTAAKQLGQRRLRDPICPPGQLRRLCWRPKAMRRLESPADLLAQADRPRMPPVFL